MLVVFKTSALFDLLKEKWRIIVADNPVFPNLLIANVLGL